MASLCIFSSPLHYATSLLSSSQWGVNQFYHSQHRFNQKRRKKWCGVHASLSDTEDYHSQRPPTPLLDTINYPIHMKNLSTKELEQLAKELRSDLIFNVSRTGGHLGSNLGVVELTVALHYVFNTPKDKILWDVGHQSYLHKILTGRRDKMYTIRQTDGLCGFTKRSESEYDCFSTGHSSTTISAGLGMAVGRDLKGEKNTVIAVIGDGAMTAGQAYEAMNNAGYLDSDMVIILNDNKQVSLPTATLDGPIPPVGALSSALNRLQSSRPFRDLREVAKGVTKQIGGHMHGLAAKVDEYARGMINGSKSTLFEELGLYYIGPVDGHNINDLISVLKETKSTQTTGPVLIHKKVVDILMQKKRQTSTMNLPVRFAMDRAGLVGADGPTHSGSFDVTFMACLPNMVVMAPSDEAELFHMVATAAAIDDRPSCFRYPRGNGVGVALPAGNKGTPLEIGKGRVLIEGERVALLGYGTAVQNCLAAASLLGLHGLQVTVADARFCKPLDHSLIRSLVKSHEVLITVEEGSIGGFASHVAQFMALDGLLDGNLKWRPMVLPDCYIDHGSPSDQLSLAGLTPSHVAGAVFKILGQTREALEVINMK
ncbi:hypothetical protein Ahy_A04g021354 isoform A [Arachis hypogaea]|uniref:1-deoxy-D-xylulose-5-phosphate synthase n=2 Tax=Arachis hypogaea TaxID=3818 RepID=A0A445DK17_ARAHY|nr:hypothetical protein Ahy_A04g021354 isoform A [Arachis hypogaea]